MSSSQLFQSSPLLSSPRHHRKSKFTWQNLHQLSQSSTRCPLRVISLIDLDAFYAQCEMVRLGLPEDEPLAVQQWQALIAINYPARKFGLSRHVTVSEAHKLCPNLKAIHVATWKEGDAQWAYHEDAYKNIATHKVSLDPYRKESRKILNLIKASLPPAPIQRVEKASIDEVFLDLSAQVHSILLERFPELQGPPPYDDPTELLPCPPVTALDWQADALIDLDVNETEEDDPDWDDICMLIGSEIVRDVRQKVHTELRYTCSGGIARNKMLAKLGAGNKKPNAQTVIRNRAVQHFLSDYKFTKIRMLGGKLGDDVVAMFNTDTVKELLDVPLEQLKKLGDDRGRWLYDTIRGDEHSEVSSRTQIKSMLSAKSFRPYVNNIEQARRWLRIFVADIFGRCVEEGVLENKRRPKTITLHHRSANQTRSKQAAIPQGKQLDENMLYELAANLLAHVVADGRAWPCINLSLNVGGFEDGISGNKGIGGFLVRGEEAKAMLASERDTTPFVDRESSVEQPQKRRKTERGGIQNFFAIKDDHGEAEPAGYNSDNIHDQDDPYDEDTTGIARLHDAQIDEVAGGFSGSIFHSAQLPPSAQARAATLHQSSITTYFCDRCKKEMPAEEEVTHQDEHMARDLQEEFRAQERSASATPRPAPTSGKAQSRSKSKTTGNTGARKGMEKGQKKLPFG